jgi:hypothetical protein
MGQITLNAWDKDITIEFPDSMSGDASTAFASQYGYEATVLDDDENEIPNPLSEVEFTIHQILDYIKDVIRAAGIKTAKDEAVNTARLEIEDQLTQIDLTIEDGGA